jgi:hypothetical protein
MSLTDFGSAADPDEETNIAPRATARAPTANSRFMDRAP